MDVVVVGGGFGGVSAALGAAKAGASVILIERTDMLLGTGLVGGIFRNNGRFTVAEECVSMGAGELFEVMDRTARHKNIEFPRHKHASLFDVYKIEPNVRRILEKAGVEVILSKRVKDVKMDGRKIAAVVTDGGEEIRGKVFVDATGTSGVPRNCAKYGNGCSICIQRCYAFNPRISITEKAGVPEYHRIREDGKLGVMSGSCKIAKESLGNEVKHELEKNGVVVIPLPKEMIDESKLVIKACVQYAYPEYIENVILLDTGPAKLMASYFPLSLLRKVPGLEDARYEDPIAGGRGNSVRFLSMAYRDNTMRAVGPENLFVAGEKSGPQVGHTEAIASGILAGYNAALHAYGKDLMELPRKTTVGDFIAFINEEVSRSTSVKTGYTFSGGIYFDRMKQLGFYTTDVDEIQRRIEEAGVRGVFEKRRI